MPALEVVLGVDMYGNAHGAVTDDLGPLLAAVDVAKFGALCIALHEDLDGFVVHFKCERDRNSSPIFLTT